MEPGTQTAHRSLATAVRPVELELADGTRLVPDGAVMPARVDGDSSHVFRLADVQREGAEPFAGYRLEPPHAA